MSKHIIVGDYHLGIYNDKKFLNYQFKIIDWIHQLAVKHEVDSIIHLGDYIDKRTSIDYETLYLIQENIEKCNTQYDISHVTLTGNHDTYYKNSSLVNFQDIILDKYPNYNVVSSTPTELDDILFIPWINESNEDKCIDILKKSSCQYVMGHFDIVGFKMSKNYHSHTGLNSNLFKRFKKVISGHYHLSSRKSNIIYVGTPYQLNWNDVNDKKYVYLFDTETGIIKRLENKLCLFEHIIIEDDSYDVDKAFYKNKFLKVYLNCDITIKIQNTIDWLIANNTKVDTISKDIIIQDNEELEDIINSDVDTNITESINIMLNDMDDIEEHDRECIMKIFKDIQTDSLREGI
jgi:DNA repair exonuclease SbcCD nuclease subunit